MAVQQLAIMSRSACSIILSDSLVQLVRSQMLQLPLCLRTAPPDPKFLSIHNTGLRISGPVGQFLDRVEFASSVTGLIGVDNRLV